MDLAAAFYPVSAIPWLRQGWETLCVNYGLVPSMEQHLPQMGRLLTAFETEAFEDCEPLFLELQQALEFLYSSYVAETQFLAAHEAQSETAETIGKVFVEVFMLLNPLGEEIQAGDFGLAQETADTLKEAIESLYSLFERFTEQGRAAPKLSEVPFTHELVRVCRLFLEGHLSVQAVWARLDQFIVYHENLSAQIEASRPSGAEAQTLMQNSEDLSEALRAQSEGISELEQALETGELEREAFESALELLLTSAEVLVDIYRALEKADREPRALPCVKCSHPNPPTSRTCGKCGAVLPGGSALSDESVSTVAFEEDGTPVYAGEPEELMKLQRAVRHFAATGELEPVRQMKAELACRLQRVERRFSRMDAPANLQPQQKNVLDSARKAFQRGVELMTETVQLLNEGEQSDDLIRLESAVEKMREANQAFEGLRSLMDESVERGS